MITDSPNNRPRRDFVRDSLLALIQQQTPGTHLTAIEISQRLRDQGIKVSLATIYRMLHRLEKSGDVGTVPSDSGKRYEAASVEHDHDHLICLRCGLTIEFTDDLIKGLGTNLAARKGYDYHGSRFDIFGFCATCRRNDNYSKVENLLNLLAEAKQNLSNVQKELTDAEESAIKRRTQSCHVNVVRSLGLVEKVLSVLAEAKELSVSERE